MRRTSEGPGRALVSVYGVLALAACARGGFEVTTKFHEAPLSYSLALFAGVVYAVATLALATNRRWLAWPTVLTEMVGVIVVGTLSFVAPGLFRLHASVWSSFGVEYFLVPLVLPFLGVSWLRRSGRAAADEDVPGTAPDETTPGAGATA